MLPLHCEQEGPATSLAASRRRIPPLHCEQKGPACPGASRGRWPPVPAACECAPVCLQRSPQPPARRRACLRLRRTRPTGDAPLCISALRAPPHGDRAAAHLCTCAAERQRAAPLCAGAGPPLFSAPARARCLCEDGAAFAAAQTQRASRGRSCILLCTDSGVLRRRSSVLLSTDLGVRARGTARAELRSAQHRPGGHRKGGAPFSSAQTLGALPRFGTTRGSIDGRATLCRPSFEAFHHQKFKMQWPEDMSVSLEGRVRGLRGC
ncbi:uncharacterized protein [Symphalangus syndactylus]|uniref:uncharacterized protein n=1 Tax=Symphalangus syndactylus TaxID=9590 RepID=UPI003005BDD6